LTRVTEAWLFSRVLSGMNAGESETQVTPVTRVRTPETTIL
jgi:hypothetical protein